MWVEAPAREAERPETLVAFPGGGLFFWWQAGYVQALQQQDANLLRSASFAGASAGALTAVLTASGVDMAAAYESAYNICEKRNVWTQPLGLFGCWGAIVEEWLNELLPPDAHEICSGRVFILVTSVHPQGLVWPPLQRQRVCNFSSREDLISTCLASVHLPWVMDGGIFRNWRGLQCVDGSVLAAPDDLHAGGAIPQLVVNYYKLEPEENRKDEAFFDAKPGPKMVLDLMSRGAQTCNATASCAESPL